MIRLPLLDDWPADRFPNPAGALTEPNGLLAFGGDLSVTRLRAAYAQGIFPWFNEGEPILWWSPDPRCVFHTDQLRVNRSLRRQLAQCDWQVTADRAFGQVIRACAAPRADQAGTWISASMIGAYSALHEAGYAHSVEVWDKDTLIGGIYGVVSGSLFSGESMFSRRSGGSRVALIALARLLAGWGFPLIDAQVSNPHLRSLGAAELPRRAFLTQLLDLRQKGTPASSWSNETLSIS